MATQHSRSAARVMMAPAVILLLGWMLVPLTMTLYFSFKKYLPLRGGDLGWVGFDNYVRFVSSSSFWPAVLTTLIIVGGVLIDNTGATNGTSNNNNSHMGNADLNDTHDWLAGSGAVPAPATTGAPTYDGHPSTPAFIAFRLIQRLYTSNPSRDYVYRVAKVFNDTGGDLAATSKAVFLDYEARTPGAVENVGGRKKPPIEARSAG